MQLSAAQHRLIERVINTAETGKPSGDYAALSVYADGPHGIRQITYGRAQTTEYGNLRELVTRYVAAKGLFSAELAEFADEVGSHALTENTQFKTLLRNAARQDPLMRDIQDQFFNDVYFDPAMRWADNHGFTLPLSAMIIYDSFIHSGGILWLLRQKFPEDPPSQGGDEKAWIRAYTQARHQWLKNHAKQIVGASAYRTEAYLHEIERGNWDLAQLPINMNGSAVFVD